jgi:hypothetical protein
MNCECPNLCRVVDASAMPGRQPKDFLRMHPAYGCTNTATVTIQIKCPTEGCKDEERELCAACLAQYRRWITTWEYVECIQCKRFYDTRDYWVLPKKEAA